MNDNILYPSLLHKINYKPGKREINEGKKTSHGLHGKKTTTETQRHGEKKPQISQITQKNQPRMDLARP